MGRISNEKEEALSAVMNLLNFTINIFLLQLVLRVSNQLYY